MLALLQQPLLGQSELVYLRYLLPLTMISTSLSPSITWVVITHPIHLSGSSSVGSPYKGHE